MGCQRKHDGRMSLPNKGSRRIVVDDIAYRWRVRHKPTHSQGDYACELQFAVQRESFGRCTLSVILDQPRPDNWLNKPGAVVTPALVAQAVRQALQQGWQASSNGSAFVLRLPADKMASSIQTVPP